MRAAIAPHDVTDLRSSFARDQVDLTNHLVGIHGWSPADVRRRPADELDVEHANEHDDLERGIGAARGLR